MKKSAYDVKGSDDYNQFAEQAIQLIKINAAGGSSAARNKEQALKKHFESASFEVLNVLAADDEYPQLRELALAQVENHLKRVVKEKREKKAETKASDLPEAPVAKKTKPFELIKRSLESIRSSSEKPFQSVRQSMEFNFKVMLPALVALKKAQKDDGKALTSFLEKQSPENLQRLMDVKPKKGVVSQEMAAGLKGAVRKVNEAVEAIAIVKEVTQLTEKMFSLEEKKEQQPSGITKERLSDEINKLSLRIEKFRQHYPEQVKAAHSKLAQQFEESKKSIGKSYNTTSELQHVAAARTQIKLVESRLVRLEGEKQELQSTIETPKRKA